MRPGRGNSGLPTITDIAQKAGVSRTTVCMSLKDHPRISVETKALVRSVAREMGYRTDHVARKLVNKRLGISTTGHIVAMVCPWDYLEGQNYYNRIMLGVLNVMVREKFSLLAQYPLDSHSDAMPDVYTRGDVDGVVMYHNQYDTVEALRVEPGFDSRPIVSITWHIEGCSSVLTDDFGGAYESADHLLALGHRHILHFVADSPSDPVRTRYLAYRKACEDHGLDPDSVLHHETWLYKDPGAEVEMLTRTFDEHPEISAVLLRTDAAVAPIYRFLQERELRVPEDVSMIGFDDVEELPGPNGGNMLTSVNVPLFDMGVKAARIIVDRASGKTTEEEVVFLQTNLIVRGSTAPPPK